MVNWKDKKYVLFGFNGTLIKQNFDNACIVQGAEKFLFFLSNLDFPPEIHLVSNMPIEDLRVKIRKTGLDYFMNKISSSLSTGLVKADINFWVNYLEDNKINSKHAVVFDDNPKVSLATAAIGLDTVLLTENNYSVNLQYELSDQLIKYKNNILFVNNFAELLPQSSKIQEVC